MQSLDWCLFQGAVQVPTHIAMTRNASKNVWECQLKRQGRQKKVCKCTSHRHKMIPEEKSIYLSDMLCLLGSFRIREHRDQLIETTCKSCRYSLTRLVRMFCFCISHGRKAVCFCISHGKNAISFFDYATTLECTSRLKAFKITMCCYMTIGILGWSSKRARQTYYFRTLILYMYTYKSL